MRAAVRRCPWREGSNPSFRLFQRKMQKTPTQAQHAGKVYLQKFKSDSSLLSCVPVFRADNSAPIFFFALPKKKTVAGGQKKKGALYELSKGTIQPGFLQTAGAYGASSKGLCAPPDAQPLTLAVCAAWRCHCRFHSVRRDGEKAENLLNRPALPRRTTRDSAMPHLPNPTVQTSAAFVRWKGDAAA